MVRLIIAIVIGAAVAGGGTFAVKTALSSAANGTPPTPTQSLYVYGNR